MVRTLVTMFRAKENSQVKFEAIMKDLMVKSVEAKGQLGALLLKSDALSGRYLFLGFWENSADWEDFAKNMKIREALNSVLTDAPHSDWFEGIARVQNSKYYGLG